MSVSNKNSKRGLGRGFESLIPTDLLDESFDPTASFDKQVSELRNIKIDEISIDTEQPRKNFDPLELEELAASIKEHGVLQPIIVMPFDGGYQIVAGERRYRASKIAGLDKIPALVRSLNEQHKLEVSLIENLQRKDLNVIETATAYLKLKNQFNLTDEEIGIRVGNKSSSSIKNTIRLLNLPKIVREALAEEKVLEGQVRQLIGLDESIIEEVLPKIIEEQWSARKVEQFVVDLKRNSVGSKKSLSLKEATENPYQYELDKFKKRLQTDVKIQTNSRGSGRITIMFKNERDFNRLREIIG